MRWRFVVQGIVQGVGFRPRVYQLATELGLSGFVRNHAGAVWIEVEGVPSLIDLFATRLATRPPALARIDSIDHRQISPRGLPGFQIVESEQADSSGVFISPDVATCNECLSEILDPSDRRYGYAFANCTNCGPRLTIIQGSPYDRQRTTMAAFAMCAACRREYEDPLDRRFHAQPIACPDCGPQLRLLTSRGEWIACRDPLQEFAAALRAGQLGALKGLGGYHLVCDASSPAAVESLRRKKLRDEKPFAIMVADLEQGQVLCDINREESSLLTSVQRPIVLLRRRQESDAIAPGVAPGNPRLGVMLPYSPLHHLLLRAVGGRPLVMTSGNVSDEPMAYADEDAICRLGPMVDVILTHNREIHVRCEDSVTRVACGSPMPVRRSRGLAPSPIVLPQKLPLPTLAVGGQLKSTFALGRASTAFVSHHLGDLDQVSAYEAFTRDIQLYEQLFDIQPQLIVHDLHPDYVSTRYAEERAGQERLRTLPVQHHHAHIASCIAEHELQGPVIGVAFDGTGFGSDGAIWGGEFLLADLSGFERSAHLRYVRLPGGDAAIREPWRSAVAQLHDAGCDLSVLCDKVPQAALNVVTQMIRRGVNAPQTSSMGRLFDAVAALLGIRLKVSFEGQAAMELEWLAEQSGDTECYPLEVEEHERQPMIIETRPIIRSIVEDVRANVPRAVIARRFHATIAELIGRVAETIRNRTGVNRMALSGGVFMNAVLMEDSLRRLTNAGFEAFRQTAVPPNDGGLCLGQLAIAASFPEIKPVN